MRQTLTDDFWGVTQKYELGSTYVSCSIGFPDITLKLNVREVVQLTSKMLLVQVRTKRFGGL